MKTWQIILNGLVDAIGVALFITIPLGLLVLADHFING
jgi:hypothetical protein